MHREHFVAVRRDFARSQVWPQQTGSCPPSRSDCRETSSRLSLGLCLAVSVERQVRVLKNAWQTSVGVHGIALR